MELLPQLQALREEHIAHLSGEMAYYADAADHELFIEEYSQLFAYIETGGGLVEKEDCLLMIHRRGRWDLPKGKIEPDEGLLEAACREIAEETGVTGLQRVGPLPETYHIYEERGEWYFKTGYWFVLETDFSGPLAPQAAEQITEAKWVDKASLNPDLLDTYPGVRDLLKAYLYRYPLL